MEAVCTIGHSKLPIEEFLDMLREHGVERVLDIRTVPKSRHNPRFGQDQLPASLAQAGIGYEYIRALGGLRKARKESPNGAWRSASFRGYADHMQSSEFNEHVDLVARMAESTRCALMYAEAVPWRCHRSAHHRQGQDQAAYAHLLCPCRGKPYHLPARPGRSDLFGTGALTDVERVLLRDRAVALDIDGHGGQAFRLYEAAFDRGADMVGLGFWISRLDRGISLNTVAEAFVASPEFRTLYGANPTNAEIVAKFYANILDRTPDATGVAFWNHVLDTGAASVADVLLEFSESAENIAALTGAVQNGIHYMPYGGD